MKVTTRKSHGGFKQSGLPISTTEKRRILHSGQKLKQNSSRRFFNVKLTFMTQAQFLFLVSGFEYPIPAQIIMLLTS